MAKIQTFSKASLPFITRDNVGLDLNATDDNGEHPVTLRTVLVQQDPDAAGDLTKISLVRNYAMLDNLCKSRTQFPKWKCGKDLRIDKNHRRKVKSAHQILPGVGVYPGLPADGGVDHGHQRSGYLDHRNSTHESGGNEARQIPDHATAERYHGRVATVPFREHLIGESGPGVPGLVGLAGGDDQQVRPVPPDAGQHGLGVPRPDVGVGDESVSVRWGDLARNGPDLGQETRRNTDRSPDLSLTYQVTSPAPVRTFATRASMKSRSESRFK